MVCKYCGSNKVRTFNRKNKNGVTITVKQPICKECFNKKRSGIPLYITKGFIIEEHHNKGKSLYEIVDEQNITIRWLKKFVTENNIEELHVCTECGTRDNLVTKIINNQFNVNKMTTLDICEACLYEKKSKNIKKSLSKRTPKQKKESVKKYLKHYEDNPDKKKKEIEKKKQFLKDNPRISKEWGRKCSETKQKYTPERKAEIVEKYKKSMSIKTEKEKKVRLDNISKGVKKSLTKMYKTKRENNTFNLSSPENECYLYIKEFIDNNVKRQVHHIEWNIDFYLPKYDLYVQFDGDYWHGYLNTEEELKETIQGNNILKTIKRDKKQNKKIKNLIRVRESEFKKDKNILNIKINKYLKEG